MFARHSAARVSALVATMTLSFYAEAKGPRPMSSLSDQNGGAERKLGKRAAEYDGSLFDAEHAGALAAKSSFPIRLSYGTRASDSWDKLPEAATEPKSLRRNYNAARCAFTLATGSYEVRLMKADGNGGYIIANDMLGPQTTVKAPSPTTQYVTVVADLTVKMNPSSEASCRKLFAGRKKKVRFASISLDGGSVWAESRSGTRLNAEPVTNSRSTDLYLTWNGSKKTLRVTDRAGLPVSLETSVVEIPAGTDGIYYLAYEPAWRVARDAGYLAAN